MVAALLLAMVMAVTNVTVAVDVSTVTNLPPQMVAVWQQAERECRRTAELLSNGAIDAAEAVRRRAAIRRAFVRVCRHRGLPEEVIDLWQDKIRY